ncbi:transposase [Tsuneonella suprasediminis]|uniref:Transposase n=1 Tax=Tsuneonella suprasediminis TaxID=2306996 RepID=A0A419R318_9SPHN|nr:DDE-type integrase/transposase/recombinase [Tsuneonella suprasediminis]RJX68509.1 transposase [Tsuneonella suprasediminis]
MNKNTINGAIGSTFINHEGLKLHLERELGDGLLNVLELPSGRVHRYEDPDTGELRLPDTRWLESGLADSSLRLHADDRGVIPHERILARVHDREEILQRDPYAEARLAVMLPLIEKCIEGNDPKLGAEIRKIWTEDLRAKFGNPPQIATVRGWFGRCHSATVTLADMMSMSGRVPRVNRLDPAVEEIIDVARNRFWRNRGWKIVDVHAEVSTEIGDENLRRIAAGEPTLNVPGKETIRRRVNELLCRETYAQKYGEAAARRKFDGSGKGISAYRILQIGLMDDTVVDLVTVLDMDRGFVAGRPYLTVLIDVYSRCVLAMTVSFQPPTVAKAAECVRTAMSCLREGNRPKIGLRKDWLERHPALATINGKFAKIVTDNGFNYVVPAFSEMMLDLGIVHELAPVRSPRHKAIVERFFRSFNTFLIDKLPGATLDPSIMRKFGIDPSSEACITLSELRELISQFLRLYHITHHSGIDAVPLQKWAASAAVHGRDMILDERLIDVVTGVTVHRKRITAGGGLRMFDMTWKGAGIEEAINRLAAAEPHKTRLEATAAVTTKVKYDPDNLLYAHIFVGDDWIRVENTQSEYAAGLSLWQHRQVRAWSKRESLNFVSEADRLAARHALNLAIREAFPGMDARERRAAARLAGPGPKLDALPDVEFAEAEPRHDGMGPIIEQDVPANEREDAHRAMSRPGNEPAESDETEKEDTQDQDTPIADPRHSIIQSSAPDDDDDEEEYR